MYDVWLWYWYWWGCSDGGDGGIVVVLMVVMAVVRVANVIVVGVLYLSVYLLVGNGICSSIGGEGGGWRWWFLDIGGDGG